MHTQFSNGQQQIKLHDVSTHDDTTLYFNLEDFDCRNLDNVINSEIKKNINLWLKLNKLSRMLIKRNTCFSIPIKELSHLLRYESTANL